MFDSTEGAPDPERLLAQDFYDPASKQREVERWLDGASGAAADDPLHHHHESGISSFCLQFEAPLDWTAFGIWMTMLLHRHGEKVLRVKGMLNVAGVATPVLINGVQHIVHPPAHLDDWPDGDRRSRIVFIVRDIARARIEASLAIFNTLANPQGTEGALSGNRVAAPAG